MAQEKQTKKNTATYKNFIELEKLKEMPPQVLVFCSEDSYEFDLIVDLYKSKLSNFKESLEIIVFVSEPGDLEKLFSELGNLSMFSSLKLIIIKSAAELFKPVLSVKAKKMYETLKHHTQNLAEKLFIVIHYNDKDVPDKLTSLFAVKTGLIKNKEYYLNERKDALDLILDYEKVSLDHQAFDEFVYKVTATTGSYIKNIRKLKLVLNKRAFTQEDIQNVLFDTSEFNPFYMTDYLFSNNIPEFYKEFTKLQSSHDYTASFLSLLTSLLNRTDEMRKAKVLFARMKNMDDYKFNEIMGFSSYSDKRKAFLKSKLKRETSMFNERSLSFLYDLLVRLNIMFKTSPIRSEIDLFFSQKIRELFFIMNER